MVRKRTNSAMRWSLNNGRRGMLKKMNFHLSVDCNKQNHQNTNITAANCEAYNLGAQSESNMAVQLTNIALGIKTNFSADSDNVSTH